MRMIDKLLKKLLIDVVNDPVAVKAMKKIPSIQMMVVSRLNTMKRIIRAINTI
ncbi:hypothetical protein [Heyndrickxia oleronia]|uniref:hypothetical protein n=1 Tax=Heyndrickxia oleronia TaxID=38875 RepID=UPI003F856820